MTLESYEHPISTFITLTYAPEHLPSNGSVSKEAMQLWLKRLRFELGERKIRYYLVGEYGEQSWRPHYHAIIYGMAPTEEAVFKKTWPFGHIHLGLAEHRTFSYVAGYMVKRMTNPKDKRLKGREPEFCLMSKNPGLGFGTVARTVKAYQTKPGQVILAKKRQIETMFKSQGHTYPLGRYLSAKIEEAVGIGKDDKLAANTAKQLEKWNEKVVCTTDDYERRRRARLEAQAGRVRLKKVRL